MAEVIQGHTHAEGSSEGSGLNFLVGMVILAVVLLLIIFYGLPVLRNSSQAPQINVPDKIDVNVAPQPQAPQPQ